MKSPLRYPGGKTRAIKPLLNILRENKYDFNKYTALISPFCGGCSFEFALISEIPNVNNILLCDLFKPLITFWNQVKYNNVQLASNLKRLVGIVDKNLFAEFREEIKDFIAFLGAPVSVLKLTDIMIEREIVNVTNRRKNCDLGNVNRQIEAQEKMIRAIEKIEKAELSRGEVLLKPDLKITAAARKEYADDTLVELAARLSITKSCLNHRLRKISEIADKLGS